MRFSIWALFIFTGVIGMVLCSENQSSGFLSKDESIYYYSQDEKVYLQVEDHKYILGINQGSSETLRKKVLNKYNMQQEYSSQLPKGKYFVHFEAGLSPRKQARFAEEIMNEPFVAFIYPVMRTVQHSNGLLLPTNEILCAPKSDVSDEELRSILGKIGSQVRKDEYYGNFVLIIKKEADKDVFEIANYLYESGAMDYAYPNFIAAME